MGEQVKRWDMETIFKWSGNYSEMRQADEGDFVRHEDYDAIRLRREELEREVEKRNLELVCWKEYCDRKCGVLKLANEQVSALEASCRKMAREIMAWRIWKVERMVGHDDVRKIVDRDPLASAMIEEVRKETT